MSQQSSLTQSAHSVRQVLTAYKSRYDILDSPSYLRGSRTDGFLSLIDQRGRTEEHGGHGTRVPVDRMGTGIVNAWMGYTQGLALALRALFNPVRVSEQHRAMWTTGASCSGFQSP